MRFKTPAAGAVVAVLIVAGACSDSGPAGNDDFLPIITNIWHNVADVSHEFSLNSPDDSTASGTFTGTEDHPSLGQSNLSGTFLHSEIEFTIARPAGALKYSGQFTHRDTMRLTSTAGALVLAH